MLDIILGQERDVFADAERGSKVMGERRRVMPGHPMILRYLASSSEHSIFRLPTDRPKRKF